MSFYRKMISEDTGYTDPDALEKIEECMRHDVFHSTLDWQTREQFREGAKIAVEALKEMGDLS